jgi:hypothetical protein
MGNSTAPSKVVSLTKLPFFTELAEEKRTPCAKIIGFSERQIGVMIVRPRGYHLWHWYSECLATFGIERDPQLDQLFGMTNLVSLYATAYKGVAYGDSTEAVIKALGEPDVIENWQPVGYIGYSYFTNDIAIQFHGFRVKTITHGVPDDLKEEVKTKGQHITRA